MSTRSDVTSNQLPLVKHRAVFPCEAVPYVLATADALVILIACVTGGIVYHWLIDSPPPSLFSLCGVGLAASFIHTLRMGGDYYDFKTSSESPVDAGRIFLSWTTTAFFLAFFAFLLKIGVNFSRGAFVFFFFLAPFGLLAVRKLSKTVLRIAVAKGSIGRRDIIIIGDPHELAALDSADLLGFFGAEEPNRFVLSADDNPVSRTANDVRVLKAAANYVRTQDAREILLALPWGDAGRLEFVKEHIKALPVSARLLPDKRVRSLLSSGSADSQQVLTIDVQRAPLNVLERLVKRTMDLIIAFFALLLLLPVLVLTAVAIKLDGPGPVIFRQNRKGFNGRQFVMFKFRTMRVQENDGHVRQAVKNDPRVTAIGKLLRASSIDELPQLLNVLTGDMSLIGPRPHALSHDNQFETIVSDYAYRHHVKPGITGWAQCNGARGATPSVEHISKRVELDLWYINNWSLWLDLRILVKTFFEVLRKRNAY
jgi:undecaprenyl-phosphate galactose phosphotransferase/putative colanic acid biosynthesis UDP-glucose lipid carrier transferase